MKIFFSVLIILIFSASIVAQNTKQAVARINNGEYKFAQGQILVFLADTVSPGFIEKQFNLLGYEILESQIHPVSGILSTILSDEQIIALSNHPYVDKVTSRYSSFSEKSFLEMVERQEMSSEDSIKSRKRSMERAKRPFQRVIFETFVSHEMAKLYLKELEDVNLNIGYPIPRSVSIKTKVGKETEAMRDVELLVYVTSTAFISLNE